MEIEARAGNQSNKRSSGIVATEKLSSDNGSFALEVSSDF